MKRILVPLDGSENSEHVLEHVGKLAATADLGVRILRVHSDRLAARKLAVRDLERLLPVASRAGFVAKIVVHAGDRCGKSCPWPRRSAWT